MEESGRNPLEQLADAFLERYRHGERPALTEYTQKYPELAAEIRDLFPALVMMEEAGPHKADGPATFRGKVTADGKALRCLGDYRILREVGRGGMGVVYEALQESLGRHVALKVLPFDVANDPICLQRFFREARSAARLHHTNIVPVFDVGECDGLHYYAMQFIQGQGLDEVLLELRRMRTVQGSGSHPVTVGRTPADKVAHTIAGSLLTGQFAPADLVGDDGTEVKEARRASNGSESSEASFMLQSSSLSSGSSPDFHYFRSVARVGLQVAEALAYAHGQKVLHRDIKPANLLLDLHGTVWVTDFGLAKEEGEDLTRTGDVVGTLRYMAPERLSGVSDLRGDIYSLGLTLYELLTLRPAFDESDRGRLIKRLTQEEPAQPRRLDRRVPRDLETIVLKASAKERERRYQTAQELVEDLRRFLSDRPIQARRASWREQAWRWARRNKGWAATLATVAGLLLFIAVGGVLLDWRLQKALTRTQAAEQDKTEKLWRSYLERARAERSSGRMGQRFEALRALREAAKIRVTPELRNEALAALVLPDVEMAREWDGWPDDALVLAFDAALERYARMDRQGGVTVCRLGAAGEEVLARLPARGQPPWAGVGMSPDGRFVLCIHSMVQGRSGGYGICAWKLDGPRPALWLDEAGTFVSAFAFRADGRQLAIGSDDGVITIHDLATGKPPQRLAIGATSSQLVFDPQGGRLAAACGNTVGVFDVEYGRQVAVLRHPEKAAPITGLAWHPDGRRLATGCEDRKIHIWDVRTASEIMPPLTGHTNVGIALAFNHAGDRLVSDDWNAQTRFWDARTGRLLLTLSSSVGHHFGPDDRLLGYQREGKKLRLFQVAAGRELRVLRRLQADSAEQIDNLAIDPDSRLLAVSSNPHWLSFFDLERGEEAASVRLPASDMARANGFRDGGCLTDGSAGVLHWPLRVETTEQIPGSSGQESGKDPKPVRAATNSPLSTSLLGARSTLQTTLCVGPPRRVGPASVHGIGASPDGRILAVPQRDGAIVLDRNLSGRQIVVGPQYDVRTCAVSADGRCVVTCTFWADGRSSSARIWDVRTGEHLHDLPVVGSIWAALFSPDGRWLATSGLNEIQLWETGTWRPEAHFSGACLAFSNDGRLLVVNDVLGAIRLIQTGTWREVMRLTGPEPTWYGPAIFNADGTRLAAVPKGQHVVYVWELRQIREALRELDLDWDWPEFNPAPAPGTPLHVRVDPGLLGPVFQSDRQAVAIFSLALAFQPLNAEAYCQRGLAYGRLRDARKAIADYQCFLALAPSSHPRRSEILFRRAANYQLLKDYDAALQDLHQLTSVSCDQIVWQDRFAMLCNDVAWHYVMEVPKKGFPGQALDLIQKARELGPYNFWYQNTLGGVCYRMGRYQEAIGCLEEKLKTYPDYAAFDLYLLAMSYQRLGQAAPARSCYDRADAWWSANPGLDPHYKAELTVLRAEAAGVLKLPVGGSPPAKDQAGSVK